MKFHQLGITNNLPCNTNYILCNISSENRISEVLHNLQRVVDGQEVVLALGDGFMKKSLEKTNFYKYNEKTFNSPGENFDLILWVKIEDGGEIFHKTRSLINILKPAFDYKIIRGVSYLSKNINEQQINYDLSGFEDGTENPKNLEKEKIALVNSTNKSINGSSMWALQLWQHDFDWLDKTSQAEKEKMIGRSLDDNREFKNNTKSAHVSKTAKEQFSPVAHTFRSSMPWINDRLEGGLMFSSFADNFDSFESQFQSMLGLKDNIKDDIFKMSDLLWTSYFFCPPFRQGKLDFSLFDFNIKSII